MRDKLSITRIVGSKLLSTLEIPVALISSGFVTDMSTSMFCESCYQALSF